MTWLEVLTQEENTKGAETEARQTVEAQFPEFQTFFDAAAKTPTEIFLERMVSLAAEGVKAVIISPQQIVDLLVQHNLDTQEAISSTWNYVIHISDLRIAIDRRRKAENK